jgi:hypothetical protein
MEVHHHSHSSGKKWTHYFWEFFMLFLAVSAGFLVENQREHFVEHQRAKIYATNLYDELKKDTIQLNDLSRNLKNVSSKLDTFCTLVKEDHKQTVTNGMLYYYSSFVTNVEYFSSNNTTIEQLKSSGNLRIMGNKLAYKISEYDRKNHELEKEYSLSKVEFSKMEDLHFKLFDIYISEKMFDERTVKPRDSAFLLTNLPVNKEPGLMNQYTGWLKFESGIYKYQANRYLGQLKKIAIELLTILKEEYSFK